jgi:RNA polymerase sigma-70 factor (ECF subfamily)
MQPAELIEEQITEIYRAESRRVLATLIRLLGDFDLAEEALQEAFTAALEKWPAHGIPQNPRAWLVSTGRFKTIDTARRAGRGRELATEAARDVVEGFTNPVEDGVSGEAVQDDQLRLIFTCCHPALPLDARIALSLREVCGLTTDEIARSYLVSTETMKRRLSRAKATIRDKQIPYEIPSSDELGVRLDAVLHVVYLIYNEGYAATSGHEHVRRDLAKEAVFLGRFLIDLIPQPDAIGLLALLLLHESRSATRVDEQGDPVPLEVQDRSLWNRSLIDEGLELLQRAVLSGRLGSYTIQAAIVSVHAVSESVATTNWALIIGYYDMLLTMQNSPVVELQRAIAIGMREGPEAGLILIDQLIEGEQLAQYHQIYAARADLARRAGAFDQAAASYEQALALVREGPERRYLLRQLEEIRK